MSELRTRRKLSTSGFVVSPSRWQAAGGHALPYFCSISSRQAFNAET
jgi:hypothetical protein